MRCHLKISDGLLKQICNDLQRPHPIAYERVGFLSAGATTLPNDGILLLAKGYQSVPDVCYLASNDVGAIIDSNAIRNALEWSLQTRSAIFLIHQHDHIGTPSFSWVDKQCNKQLVPDFFKVTPELPHGALLLSHDQGIGRIWLDHGKTSIGIEKISVIGSPLCHWRHSYEHS